MKQLFKYILLILLGFQSIKAQVTLEKEVKITDLAMYFDGKKVALNTTTNSTTGYDYVYGTALTPHGDCIKVFDKYVFLTWYRGGKQDRHVMLTRYNIETGTQKTIEFPHQHTGYNGKWWIGETHNTISVGICPKNGTIHMLYDLHRNGNVPAFANDYLRYSYTVENAATVSDEDFNINLFVQSPNNNYKHLSFPGINDVTTTKLLTYPAFFTNDEGDLFMKNRFGYSENGKFLFAKYNGVDWEGYTDFNRSNASSYESAYNWGLYGDIKFLNGKIRIGFQQRANIKTDKYLYQNGFYYAYSDDPSGLNQWKDHKGTGFTRPMSNSNIIKIAEPGDVVATTQKDKNYMVGGFDWTVTSKGDIHFIGKVRDNENNVTKYVHTYKPAGASDFITTTDFTGAEELYASGENVYIIGLNSSGRPFIETALGGTNNFTRVYEATSGKRFRKGVVNIYNGKLYYYLLENNTADSDDTQPTYLQIIDLAIVTEPQPFAINLISPNDGQSFEEGDEVQLYANATVDTGEISKVEFILDGSLYAEDTSKPYLVNWTAQTIGMHTVQAIAYKSTGETISSTMNSIEVNEVDKTDLSGEIYRLKNLITGKYLQSNGAEVIPNDTGEGDNGNTEWQFVQTAISGVKYYNIDSMSDKGILRFANSPIVGTIINTSFSAPRPDVDKVWKVIYNEVDNSYQFQTKDLPKFLYHETDNTIIHSEKTDDRSKWLVELEGEPLSVNNIALNSSGIKVYPNPANTNFSLALNNMNTVNIKIYTVLGKLIYNKTTSQKSIQIENNSTFKSGVYLIKVIDDTQKVHYSKLVIE